MSYQDFLQSQKRNLSAPSTAPSSFSRKPSNLSSQTPTTQTPSLYSSVTSNAPTNQPASTSTPKPTQSTSRTPLTTSRTPSTTSLLTRRPSATPSQSSSTPQQPQRRPLTQSQIDGSLRICLDLQNTAVRHHSKRPFAALLLGPDNAEILLRHFSISHVQHAECELARLATIHFSQEYLWACTLVSTWEPCAMCAGTIYWSNIGRVVYAAGEEKLKELTGRGNGENMTMGLECRVVLGSGQKDVEVLGPVVGWEERVVEASREWWREHAAGGANGGVNGTKKGGSSVRSSVVDTPVEDHSDKGTVGEDGEYKADLKIDWMGI